MTELEQILDECLDQILSGAASVDDCLMRYPRHADQLRPLLHAALRLERGRELKPSSQLKARIRSNLTGHTRSNPRRKRRIFPFWKIAVALAVFMMAFLATGTAYAQSAFPGDLLYDWKLTSERAWRIVSADPIGTDLRLADRRLQEYFVVSKDPVLSERALRSYREVLNTLQSEANRETQWRIRPLFEEHQESLKDSGLNVPELEDFLVSR